MMITPEEVIRRISMYYSGGMLQFLTAGENRAKAKGVKASQTNDFDQHSINRYNAPNRIAAAIETLPQYPGGFRGRGIVICAGGIKYFTCAWVCINMIRHWGCTLPIELWFQGPEEMDQRMVQLLQPLGVRCVDAKEVEKRFPRRSPGGWELKSYAIIHSTFEEVLLLDADNVPCCDPAFYLKRLSTTGPAAFSGQITEPLAQIEPFGLFVISPIVKNPSLKADKCSSTKQCVGNR